ncbi:hypothetical protein CPB83DRAFT_908259 [Crepidotus variabilis]|uniref:Uncharacterized protein n=1 Tax=Crepidotus variabilis TaxID=179855 RepID=A0A9P6JMZ4_9AGAR|nr:hypothetical protein CPB83DRAFT_908259 [Crepidotus variabilis]
MDQMGLILKLWQLLNQVKSLEILPGGLDDWISADVAPTAQKSSRTFPFMLVEGNLGIPKQIIYALYLSAIARPLRFGPKVLDTQEVYNVISASAVVLILNSGHQTALHARKRLIQSSQLENAQNNPLSETIAVGASNSREVYLVSSLDLPKFPRHLLISHPHILRINHSILNGPLQRKQHYFRKSFRKTFGTNGTSSCILAELIHAIIMPGIIGGGLRMLSEA